MHRAAEIGDLEEVQRLLKNGDPKDVPDDQGQHPLHYAAVFGRHEVMQHLLDANVESVLTCFKLLYGSLTLFVLFSAA